MADIRDKIATIAGHDGHGAIARAAQKMGVSQRTIHRALVSGPSPRLAEMLRKAEDEALIAMGGGDYDYECLLRDCRKTLREHVKKVRSMSREGVSIEDQLRAERTLGYTQALIDIAAKKDRKSWLMHMMRGFATQIGQYQKR